MFGCGDVEMSAYLFVPPSHSLDGAVLALAKGRD